MVDVYCKWHRNNILFLAKYKDLRPDRIVAEYEDKIARLIYFNENHCDLYYMRHTGQWWDITHQVGNSFKQCLKGIKELPHFTLL